MNISVVQTTHIEEIREIYAPFVETGFVTFETEVPDITSFTQRIAHYTQKYPWLVMEENGKVLGYAYASAYRERIAYQWMVECSVYVHPNHQQKGIAAQLYRALFDLLKVQGFYKVFAVITVPNPQSTGFHEKMGFTWFATYENVGYKSEKWHNVGWWQLILASPTDDSPTPPLPFSDLKKEVIDEILNKYTSP